MYVVGFPHIPGKKKEKFLKKERKKEKTGYSCGIIMYVVGFTHIPGFPHIQLFKKKKKKATIKQIKFLKTGKVVCGDGNGF